MSPFPSEDMHTFAPRDLVAEQLADWRFLAGKLRARFVTRNFARGVSLVDRIGVEADAADHHPDIDLRYGHLDITLTSHDVGGITARDVRLARLISEMAADMGVAAEPTELQVVTLSLDTADADEIRPFWQAVLGLRPEQGFDSFLFDPDGHTPGLVLQATETHERPKQRFHVDLDVAPEVVQDRIDRAIAAGGTLVSDAHAPAWWTLADLQGNQVDIATWEGRG